MTRACFLLLADTETHDAMGRVALTRATEFVEAGDEAVVIVDGPGPDGCPSSKQKSRRAPLPPGLRRDVRTRC